jgi:hypothetical protein
MPRSHSDARAHVPTSAVLERLLADAPTDQVSLAWVLGRLRGRAFGFIMLLMGLVGLAPGASLFMGILLAFPAFQMILARESPALPRFIVRRTIATPQVARLARRAIPVFRRMELFIRPRWHTPFEATKRAVGFVVLLLAATLVWPFPFSHIIPALVIILVSFAYLEEDGVLLCVSLAAAIVSLSITAATIWAAVRVTDLLTPALRGD